MAMGEGGGGHLWRKCSTSSEGKLQRGLGKRNAPVGTSSVACENTPRVEKMQRALGNAQHGPGKCNVAGENAAHPEET